MSVSSRRIPSALTGVLALVLPLLVVLTGPAEATTTSRSPVVSPELTTQIAYGSTRVIVTAWEPSGLDALDALGVASHRLTTAPIAFASLTAAQLDELRDDSRIRSLWHDEQMALALDTSTGHAGADQAQDRYGVDGTRPSGASDGDVVVAVVDTGIDTLHPDLDGGKVLHNYEVVDVAPDELQLVESPDTDDHGHGTHVASTIAGLDDDGGNVMDGVAPGAKLLGYSINASNTVSSTRALVAFDDVIAKREAGMNVVAISNSWGGGPGDHVPDAPLSVMTKRAFDAGVAVVFAAGNSGDELNTASDECTMPWAICVGAITKGRTLAGFSSRGRPPVAMTGTRPDGVEYSWPAGNHDRDLGQALEIGVFRPTLTAPGVDIIAACAQAAGCGPTGDYQSMSGTSMATPHVSGVIALVAAARQQAVGSYDLDVHQLTDLLEGTATPLPGYELWEVGVGEVNALQAVELALTEVPAAELDIPSPNLGATPGFSGPADSSEVHAVDTVAPNGWQTGEGVATGTFEVAEGTGRIRALLEWPPTDGNIYLRLYAPGAETATAESAGLLDDTIPVAGGPYMRGYRELFVNFPAAGTWRYEVLGRANVPVTDATLTIEHWLSERPSLAVADTTVDGEHSQELSISTPPRPSEGNTRVAVRGTGERPASLGAPTPYWFDSVAGSSGSLLIDPTIEATEPTGVESKVSEVTMIANDQFAGNFLTAYWRGEIDASIAGDVSLDLWVTHSGAAANDSTMFVTLFDVPTGYAGVDEAEIIGSSAVTLPTVTSPQHVSVTVPGVFATLPAGRELVVQLTSQYVDTGHVQIYHGSSLHPSGITLPLFEGSLPTSGPDAPTGLTATDLVDGVRLDWTASEGATSYEVRRSTDPASPGTLVGTVTGTSFTDTVAGGSVAYYRVTAVDAQPGLASEVVTGFPIRDAVELEQKETGGAWELIEAPTPPACGESTTVGPADGTVRVRTFSSVSVEYPQLTLTSTCTPGGGTGETPQGGGKAMGSGSLQGDDATYRFRFHTQGHVPDGQKGAKEKANLILDGEDGTAVRITDITAIGALSGPCGAVSGTDALEFHGSGTFDGASASFRVCVADHEGPSHSGTTGSADQFVLECIEGCTFSTAGTTADDRIGDGSIKVIGGSSSDGSAATGDPQTGDATAPSGDASTTSSEPEVVMVAADPTTGLTEVAVYGGDLRRIAGAPVTLEVSTLGGVVTTVSLVTAADGWGQTTLDLSGAVTVRALSGGVSSG